MSGHLGLCFVIRLIPEQTLPSLDGSPGSVQRRVQRQVQDDRSSPQNLFLELLTQLSGMSLLQARLRSSLFCSGRFSECLYSLVFITAT